MTKSIRAATRAKRMMIAANISPDMFDTSVLLERLSVADNAGLRSLYDYSQVLRSCWKDFWLQWCRFDSLECPFLRNLDCS